MKQLLLCLLLLASNPLLAIGAGTITVHSHLGQPLMLEMPLRGLGDLTDEQISIAIADLADYRKLGVEFSHSHQQLRFALLRKNDSEPLLLITSSQPIIEPYLDFVLHIKTPDNQLLKTITVLLDTPPL